MSKIQILSDFEEAAILGCRAVSDFLRHRGTIQSESLARARVGATAMSSYAGLRATTAHERALVVIERREERRLLAEKNR